MTTKELIAKLKDRKRAQQWFLQTDEERNILRTAGPQNCLYTSCEVYPEWRTPLGFGQGKTYILKPGYETEPEYDDLPVELFSGQLRCETFHGGWTVISNCVNLPNFVKFWVEDTVAVCLEDIATMIHAGKKVYARFRRE